MPMSAAEKQKKYRERLKKEHPQKYEEMIRKAKERAPRYYKKKNNDDAQKDELRRERREKKAQENLKQGKIKKIYIPMSGAEKQKRYRERLKINNPQKYEEMMKKSKERATLHYKKKINDDAQKEELRRKWREAREKAKKGKIKTINMALTPAERQKRYRERLQLQNPEKYEEIRRKNVAQTALARKTKASSSTEAQKEEMRRYWRMQKQKSRELQNLTTEQRRRMILNLEKLENYEETAGQSEERISISKIKEESSDSDMENDELQQIFSKQYRRKYKKSKPLTSAERQRRYRERKMKLENPEKYEEYMRKAKDKLNKMNSEEQKQELRRKWREAKRKDKSKNDNANKPVLIFIEEDVFSMASTEQAVKNEAEEGMADEDRDLYLEDQIKEEPVFDPNQQDTSAFSDLSSDPLRSPDAIKTEPLESESQHLESLSQVCRICGKALTFDVISIGRKGLMALKQASERRRDRLFPPDLMQVQLHNACGATYTTERLIAARGDLLPPKSGDEVQNGGNDERSSLLRGLLTHIPHNDSQSSISESVDSRLNDNESIASDSWASESSTSKPSESESLDRNEFCRICNCRLYSFGVVNVYRKGLAGLKRASAKRKDGLFPATENPESAVRLHGRCRKDYTNEKLVDADVRRMEVRELDPNAPPVEEKRAFDYCSQCVICGEDASDDYVQAQKRVTPRMRKHVSKISRVDTAEKLYQDTLDFSGGDIEQVRERLKCKDLIALGARYHKLCLILLKNQRTKSTTFKSIKRGRPMSETAPAQLQTLLDYIENNFEDSQFSLEDIKKAASTELGCHSTTIIRKLNATYPNTFIKNGHIVVIPKNMSFEDWHQNKLKDEKSERLRIVRTAANIILEDIRAIAFDNRNYPPPSSFLDEAGSMIPETLKTFVDTVVTKYKNNPETSVGTVTALSHSIMTAARPRTFKSPLLLGIGNFIHQKYAAKGLIDLLSSVGFCASYKDVTKFEVSVACHDPPETEPRFTQFVFDSVDTQTDGYTGPSLVGVQCDIPRTPDCSIARLERVPLETAIAHYDEAPLQKYGRPTTGLKNVFIEEHRDDTAILPTRGDALWLFGKTDPSLDVPGWDAFMAKIPTDKELIVSEIRALPVIYAPPSHDAVYTALQEAQKKIKQNGTCMVTFDQPLYQKAQEMVKADSNMSNVVLRLGGFHLMTSFLGTIGYIMSGSGLKELWCSIYASEETEKMMTGHAYAKAMRAHFLTRSALFNIITKDFDLTPDEILEIEGVLDGGVFDIPQTDNQGVKKYQEPLAITLELLEKRGPTAKLWVQYFRMTTLAARFIEAERTANWELHLSTLKKMLPYFHASGHFEYAKSCNLYLQDMQELESKMSVEDYENFTKKGHFAIRTTDKLWKDVWADLIVEQTMTTLMKRPGGVANGRRVGESVLANTTSAGPVLSMISDLVKDFCIPDHNAESTGPMKKENKVIAKLRAWFEERNPFFETESLVSLSSGILGRGGVNCHKAEEIGRRMIEDELGQNFQDVNFQKDMCVIPLSSVKSAIPIENFKIPIEPDTILRRIQITEKNRKKIKPCFEYELAPYPLSLFDERGMLEANKSALFDMFIPVDIAGGSSRSHVIDGEFLLRKVSWKDGADVIAIVNLYTEYVKTRFSNAVVVFGGHGNKGITMTKRSKLNTKSPVVEFQKDTVVTTSKANFFSNENNKDKFIQYLLLDFARSGITVKLSPDDVDDYIVRTAIENAFKYDETFVVSDNAELLIIMCARASKKNIYFMKLGRGKTPMTYYHVDSLTSGKIKLSILFIHALSGCDTTSAIFGKNKTKVAAVVDAMSAKDVRDLMTVFKKPNADRNAVVDVGLTFMRRLYGLSLNDLNDKRYNDFTKTFSRSRYSLACLPPSKEACIQHLYRTYHQIQKWLGNDISATDWGWTLVGDRLEPITTFGEIAPKELIDMVSCNCEVMCTGKCVCKQAGLDCCVLCLNCNGKSCHGVDMDVDTYRTDYAALSGCDVFGNAVNPLDVNEDDSQEEEECEPAPSSPKRLRRDVAQSQSTPVQCEVEQVYLVE